MNKRTFKQRLCEVYGIPQDQYLPYMMKHVLFKRARLLYPLVSIFNRDFLFHEIRLLEKAGECHELRNVQYQVDFYHHKFVGESAVKDVLKIRASGSKLVRIANEVYRLTAAGEPVPAGTSEVGTQVESLNPLAQGGTGDSQ